MRAILNAELRIMNHTETRSNHGKRQLLLIQNSETRIQNSSRAFTLIEIMVAMTIFGIVMASLFTSFRTGIKAYEMGTTHAEAQQAGRYAINQVGQDLRNIFYKKQNAYNVTRRQREALLEEREKQALQSGSRNEQVDENLPELGPPIDLSFMGEDGGETDQLSLVRQHGTQQSEDRPLWGLTRVRYYVSNNSLFRSVEDITAPETDEEGNEIPKAIPPRVDKIANHCKSFDLKYGYYFDGKYLTAEGWDSNASEYRNPPEEEDEDITDPAGATTAGGTNGTAATQNTAAGQLGQQQQQADELPAWVEVTFTFTDPRKVERERIYKQTILMYNKESQETYLPEDDEGDANARRPRSGNDSDSQRSSRSDSGSQRSSSRGRSTSERAGR